MSYLPYFTIIHCVLIVCLAYLYSHANSEYLNELARLNRFIVLLINVRELILANLSVKATLFTYPLVFHSCVCMYVYIPECAVACSLRCIPIYIYTYILLKQWYIYITL